MRPIRFSWYNWHGKVRAAYQPIFILRQRLLS
jgi:hypothetical protein